MGIFDNFKKKKSNNIINNQNIEKKDNSIKYGQTSDGRLQIDFEDKNIKVGQMYDTTRLIVKKEAFQMAGKDIYNCIVSWYSQDDMVLADQKYNGESINANQYRGVLAELDIELLQSDPEYCSKVMKSLLEKSRVEKYLDEGLNEKPEVPCGKYIGGVQKTEDGYSKFFSRDVGIESHNSKLMVDRRKELKENIEKEKQRKIEEKLAQMEKLKQEIDDMSK